MKKIFLISLSVILFASCSKDSNTTELLPLPTGTIEGLVILHNSSGAIVTNSGGVLVSVDSTSFTATTDSTGKYVIKNVPQGQYNITYSKAGYDTFKVINDNVLAATAPIVQLNLWLYQPSSTTITNFAATENAPGYYFFSGQMAPQAANLQQTYMVFTSTSSAVSPTNYLVNYSFSATTDSSFTTGLYTLYPYFPSGTTVYAVAYCTYSNTSFTNPANGKTYYAGLSATPSNVVTITLP